jgi:outer membrane protein assembly factor BamD
VIEAYKEGLKNLKMVMFCMQQKNLMKQKFYFHNQIWAPKSALMAAYSYYTQDYYGDAIAELKDF